MACVCGPNFAGLLVFMGKSVHLECGQKQPPNWHVSQTMMPASVQECTIVIFEKHELLLLRCSSLRRYAIMSPMRAACSDFWGPTWVIHNQRASPCHWRRARTRRGPGHGGSFSAAGATCRQPWFPRHPRDRAGLSRGNKTTLAAQFIRVVGGL